MCVWVCFALLYNKGPSINPAIFFGGEGKQKITPHTRFFLWTKNDEGESTGRQVRREQGTWRTIYHLVYGLSLNVENTVSCVFSPSFIGWFYIFSVVCYRTVRCFFVCVYVCGISVRNFGLMDSVSRVRLHVFFFQTLLRASACAWVKNHH